MDIKIKKKLFAATLISSAIMGFLLFQVDWEHFHLIVDRIDIRDFFLSFLFLFLANFVRSVRFYTIDSFGNKLSHWWIMNQVYNSITSTVPGVAGEAFTAYLLKRFSIFNMLSAFRILLLTRIMDLTGYSIMLFFTAMLISRNTPYREAAFWIAGIGFILSITFSHPKTERLIMNILQRISGRSQLIKKICEKLEDVARIHEERFSSSFFTMTMLQTVLMIVLAALSMHFMFLSLGADFILVQSFYCFGVYVLFQMVPVQGIAGIGTQAAWWSLALTVAGYKASDAIAMGICLYGIFYVIVAVMGITAVFAWMIIRKED